MGNIRRLSAFIVFVAMSFTGSFAYASLITYKITGEVVNGSGSALSLSDGTVLTGSFTYNNSLSPSVSNLDGGIISPNLANYGLFSIYFGAIENFSASIDGNSFSASSVGVLVGDGNGDPFSGFFGNAGVAAPGWSGFSIGDYDLALFSLFTAGTSSMLADQSLPGEWFHYSELIGGLNSGINMVFTNSNTGGQEFLNVWNLSLQKVPAPSTVSLFLLGFLCLAWRWRKESKSPANSIEKSILSPAKRRALLSLHYFRNNGPSGQSEGPSARCARVNLTADKRAVRSRSGHRGLMRRLA
jgi:hypothetical protein